LFLSYKDKSILSWTPSYWNIHFHRRANLRFLPPNFHLANTPWFVLTRENVEESICFVIKEKKLFNLVCQGGLANESLFAILFRKANTLDKIINEKTHLMDWSRMNSPTSPHLFQKGDPLDKEIIDRFLAKNPYTMFLRKVSPHFPDALLRQYIQR
jgi:hypothetical protein